MFILTCANGPNNASIIEYSRLAPSEPNWKFWFGIDEEGRTTSVRVGAMAVEGGVIGGALGALEAGMSTNGTANKAE